MTAITYGSTAGARAEIPAKAKAIKTPATAAPAKGFWMRLWDAIVEARMRQVERELRLHRHLLPADMEWAGTHLTVKNEHELPFVR